MAPFLQNAGPMKRIRWLAGQQSLEFEERM
jgi:hypothetical protein